MKRFIFLSLLLSSYLSAFSAPPPTNDHCANAISIGLGTVSGTTVGAVQDTAPVCGTTDDLAGGVWYTYQANSEELTVSLCSGTSFDTRLRVFTGPCDSLDCVAGNDDSCGVQSEVTFCTVRYETYYILVHGNGTAEGAFTLTLSSPGDADPTFTGLYSQFCTNSTPWQLTGYGMFGVFSGPGMSGDVFYPGTAGPGTHTITYTTFSGSCVYSSSQTTTVIIPPTLSIPGLAASYCTSDSPFVLVGNPPGGTFHVNGNMTNIFDPSALGAGTHNVTYYNWSPCFGQHTQIVTVRSGPVTSFTGLDSAYCQEDDPDSLFPSPPSGVFSGAGITNDQFDPGLAGPGAHMIIYTDTSGSNCTDADTHQTYVHPSPIVWIGWINPNLCLNDPTYSLAGSGNPSGGSFFGTGVIGNTFEPSVADTGAHTIYYHYTDTIGCSAMDSITTTVHPLPVLQIIGVPSDVCIDDPPFPLNASPAGGNFAGFAVSNDSFFPAVAGAGWESISYIYTDSFGCGNIVDDTINVHGLPSVSLSGLAPDYCTGDSAVTLLGSPPGGIYAGQGVSGGTFDPGAVGSGSFQLTYTYADPFSCEATDTVLVTVYSDPYVFLGPDRALCQDDSITLDPSNPGATYLWSTGDSTQTITVGDGTWGVTVTDTNGCHSSHSISIVPDIPVVAAFSSDTSLCPTIAFTDLSTGNPDQWFWDFGDGQTDSINNPSHTYSSNGTYDIVLIASDSCGSDTILYSLTINCIVGRSPRDIVPEVIVFPNPNDGLFRVDYNRPAPEMSWVVYDGLGRVVRSGISKAQSFRIDLRGEATGIYHLIVKGEEYVSIARILIE